MNNEIQEIRYQVGEAWKGTYSPTTPYGNANVVQDPTGLSVYRSLKPGNVGHPLTDTAWWFCIINLSSIKEESDRIKALNDAIAADEAQRVENENGRVTAEQGRVDAENARVTAEQGRVTAEQQRVSAEQQRASQEQTRISQEQSRVTAEQGRVAAEAQRVQKEQLRENNEAQRVINETNRVSAEAERVAQYAADHQQAVADHNQYVIDNAQLTGLVERADADHVQAGQDHNTAVADHTQAGNDHTRAESDHSTAAADHTQAGADHTQAESDHTRAESDHTTAAADHTQAVQDHETATDDHNTYAGNVLAAQTAAQNAAASAETSAQQADAAAGSAAQTEQYVEDIMDAIDNLPDGQAVSAQVAVNTADIIQLKAVVADIETIAEGYVRVAGAENPALNYRSYKYHEQGGFGRESVFHLFYPCLVGTKLSGNDAQVGKILHVLKKFGAVTIDGTPMWEDLDGNHYAIDGSDGDVLICNIEPYYQIYGQHEIQGTIYDVFLMSRVPFTWQGIDAEPVAKFGTSPDYVVSHQDSDNVVRMHSVYNPSWNGSYSAPVGVTGKYIYTTDPDTGDIVETYDENETLLGGAGGLHTTDLALYTGEQYAMNLNPDTTKTVPWMNQTAHVCELLQCLLLAEGGTFDAHKASLMGSGFSSNDGATAAADWEASGSGAKNGLRVYDKNQTAKMYALNGNVRFLNGATTGTVYAANVINSWRNPWHMLEALRAVSYAIQEGVHELEWFTFEGNKYKYRSVDGFNGPAQGEMTCVVWKMISTKAGSAAIDPTDNSTSIAGNRVDILVSTALLHGVTTQVSPSWWVSGLVFTEDASQNYEAYMERDQEQLAITPNGDKDLADSWPFESNYLHVGTFTVGEGYRKNYSNQALMIPNTNVNKMGAGLHTYVGAYNWFTGGAAPSGKKSVRGFRRGLHAGVAVLSPLTLAASAAPSGAIADIGFGTCCRIVD